MTAISTTATSSVESMGLAPHVSVTLICRNERHRVLFAAADLQYELLVQQAEVALLDQFAASSKRRVPAEWTLVYRDDEEDLVTVSNAVEFVEAKRVFLEVMPSAEPSTPLGLLPEMVFYVVPKVSLKAQLAPVLDAAEELSGKVARIAVDTKENLRKSQYLDRGRASLAASAVRTRRVLASAGRGISQRVRRASSAVGSEFTGMRQRVSLRRRTQSVPIPNEGESILVANNEEQVEEEVVMLESDATETEATIPLVAPRRHHQMRSGSDTETESSGSEDQGHEWDELSASEAMIDIASDDEELQAAMEGHAAELAAIREVLPDVDLELCLEVLYSHNFQIESTLVTLMGL